MEENLEVITTLDYSETTQILLQLQIRFRGTDFVTLISENEMQYMRNYKASTDFKVTPAVN